MKQYKKLTNEQQEQFKELYLEGYSATRIFEQLGQYYEKGKSASAGSRMGYYRKKLGLPYREINVLERRRDKKYTRYFVLEDDETTRQKKKAIKRIEKIKKNINNTKKRINKWRKEKENLQDYLSEREKEK